jgi:hypothetical protein
MTNEELKVIAEQIKSGLPIEVLDELERLYNEKYKLIKMENELSSSIEKKD